MQAREQGLSDAGGGEAFQRLATDGLSLGFDVVRVRVRLHRGDERRVRELADDVALRDAIAALWMQRADRYSELRTAATAAVPKVHMSYIGG